MSYAPLMYRWPMTKAFSSKENQGHSFLVVTYGKGGHQKIVLFASQRVVEMHAGGRPGRRITGFLGFGWFSHITKLMLRRL